MGVSFEGYKPVKEVQAENMSVVLLTDNKSRFLICAELLGKTAGVREKYDELDARNYIRTFVRMLKLPQELQVMDKGNMFPHAKAYGVDIAPANNNADFTPLDHHMHTAAMESLLEHMHPSIMAQVNNPWIGKVSGSDGASLPKKMR